MPPPWKAYYKLTIDLFNKHKGTIEAAKNSANEP